LRGLRAEEDAGEGDEDDKAGREREQRIESQRGEASCPRVCNTACSGTESKIYRLWWSDCWRGVYT